MTSENIDYSLTIILVPYNFYVKLLVLLIWPINNWYVYIYSNAQIWI